MKKASIAYLAVFLFTVVIAAAVAVTYTRQTARIVRFQCDPVYDAAGNVTAVPVQAYVVQLLVNNTDSTDIRGKSNQTVVSFDALGTAVGNSTITAAGKTITYPQWAALTRQMLLDQANAQGVQ